MGGVLGGIILLAIIVALGIYFYLRRKRRNALSPASSAESPDGFAVVLDSSSQAYTEGGGKVVLSSYGAVTSPSLPEAPMTSMRAYVRVFVPSLRSSLSFTLPFPSHPQNPSDPITFLPPQRAPCAPEVSAQSNLRPVQRHPRYHDQQASLTATRVYSDIVTLPSVRSSSFEPSLGSCFQNLLYFWFGFVWLVTTHEGTLTKTIDGLM